MRDLIETGSAHLPATLDPAEVAALRAFCATLPSQGPGQRLPPGAVKHLAAVQSVTRLVRQYLGSKARVVRALLFDKSPNCNWALGWHQDRTIEVAARRETPGYGPWTIKAGRHHVAPPVALLERMVTARLHIDAVDNDNAPLLVAPGSHRFGLIAERDIAGVVKACGQQICLAAEGDVWLYATLIVHGSAAAIKPQHRRVLQLDLSAEALPDGLEWTVDCPVAAPHFTAASSCGMIPK
ncbi:MAG: phytanoyl-CoA dioxygenase [Sphingobium sp.]|nr:phytanoyl-CoA dioxygenase [Sphingobium sp.]